MKRARVASSIFLLSLLELGRVTSGFQLQTRPSCALLQRRISFQPTCLWSASSADINETTASILEEDQRITYDWDEQFEELQKFMTEYDHCNFPQNPSKQLKQKYPMLPRFCRDQRREYLLLQRNARRHERMTLAVFDRKVRCGQLEELGFELNALLAKWYDSYHKLIEYYNVNGHTRVTSTENDPLTQWIYEQRSRGNGAKGRTELSDLQIKLLNNIGFAWESELYDAMWNEKYEELVAFRSKHGSFMMMETNSTLYRWMTKQRARRDGTKGRSAISDEQVRLLDEIDFPWEADRFDAMWFAMYDELKQFHKEHGHCEPDKFKNERLYSWVRTQAQKKRNGGLSTEQIKLLDEIGIRWESKSNNIEWVTKLRELTKYFNKHGHIQVRQEDEQELYDWMDSVRKRYHDSRKQATLSDEQIEQLEDLHFCWSLDWRDRVWHEKYTEAVEYFKEHGHISVTEKGNPSLYHWIQTQEKRYKGVKGQKPLSEEELQMIEQIEFPFLKAQPRMSWNAVYAKVTKYREENDGRLPTSHKDDPDLSRWLRHQRYRYRSAFGYASLSDEQMELLQSIDFPRYPKGKRIRQWYEMYDELVAFNKEHGHFVVDGSEHNSLYQWIHKQRMSYNGSSWKDNPLSKLQLYLLERIGFTWASERNDLKWQQRYEELVDFLEAHGRFPTKSDNKRLSTWIGRQRERYCAELSENQIEQLEKIGFRWSTDSP